MHLSRILAIAISMTAATQAWSSDATHGNPPASHGAGGAHWGYSGDEGPAHWGGLSSAYAACGQGHMQSPIDIGHAREAGLVSLSVEWDVTPLEILNNGHTVQVDYAPGSWTRAALAEYQLLQFHFHTPSEHTVGGKPFPMEAHFVHKDKEGHLGVIGVMFKEGRENLALAEIWNHLPKEAGQHETHADVAVNGRDLLPRERTFYRYSGSLTTPPCSEGVNWYVMAEPVEASADQIKAFQSLFGANNRPVQPLNNRLLLEGTHR